ncbi:DnaJ subfamily B member 8 [Thelohanellus kitauei]|uniref:DnaJ subfamily B member 8 n=1 Tax=Thelohanellus kitauei TaxID=669202 RepID=A0A0C2MF96_THEKT|nr:DnaJ subfamily B member 8 [Thelohanellus kitauei]
MANDYYRILGLTKNATAEDIVQAYKKQALKWHPDKNASNRAQAEAKFKEVSEAYQILSDKNLRSKYDRYGSIDTMNEGYHASFFDPFSMFENFMRGGLFDDSFSFFGHDFDTGFDPHLRLFSDRSSDGGFNNLFSRSLFSTSDIDSSRPTHFTSVSTKTVYRNGKKVTEKRTNINGVENVEIYEDDKLVSNGKNKKSIKY